MSQDSYKPLQNGIGQEIGKYIEYNEIKPSLPYANLVHCYWILKTKKVLGANFEYSVLPDACIDIVFDIEKSLDPIIMTPNTRIETINLGKTFYYAGIRFKPGVFGEHLNIPSIVGNQKELMDIIGIKISPLNKKSHDCKNEIADEMETVVKALINDQVIAQNDFVENVVRGLQYGLDIKTIALKLKISERHLRRTIKRQTGFSPIQLRRVIRFQNVLSGDEPLLRFADQSHLIKEFKAVTGKTYNSYVSSHIDVRNVQF